MRKSSWLVAAGLAVSFAAGSSVLGQETPKPTKEHKLLREDVGTWDATVKFWADPNASPTESKATEVNRLLPGGLWLLSEFKSEMGGQPFHGRGQTGFDTVKKKYVGTWVDSMTTAPMIMEGTYDEASKTLTMTGDLESEQGKASFKEVVKRQGAEARSFTLYMKPGGAGDYVKIMEVDYKKRPKAPAGEAKKKKD